VFRGQVKDSLKICAKGCMGDGCTYNDIASSRCENGIGCERCIDFLAEDAYEIISQDETEYIGYFKAWLSEIMLNTDNAPTTPMEIIQRIDSGGLQAFINDTEVHNASNYDLLRLLWQRTEQNR